MMMSRTACCFVALGISFAAFAAACGDDDGGCGTGGNGGSGGNGASGGSAGSSSTAGEGGAAGSGIAGTGNTAGEGGNAGTGQAGSGNAGAGNAGTAGAAGNGSVVEPDAGPDSGTGEEPDSGVVDAGNQGPVDGGVNGDCPNFATATAQAAPQDNQPVEIVRVTIDPGGTTATVVLRGNDSIDVGGFNLGDIQFICNGPEDADCTDFSELVTLPAQLALNAEIAVPGVPIADAAEGELVLATGLPSDVGSGTFAYIAYGANFDSVAPAAGGVLLSWEARASADGFWTLLDRIPVTTQNTILLGGNTGDANNGDTSKAAGFGICTADQF